MGSSSAASAAPCPSALVHHARSLAQLRATLSPVVRAVSPRARRLSQMSSFAKRLVMTVSGGLQRWILSQETAGCSVRGVQAGHARGEPYRSPGTPPGLPIVRAAAGQPLSPRCAARPARAGGGSARRAGGRRAHARGCHQRPLRAVLIDVFVLNEKTTSSAMPAIQPLWAAITTGKRMSIKTDRQHKTLGFRRADNQKQNLIGIFASQH